MLGGTEPDERGGYVDVYDTLATLLVLAERSRNDPAFQTATRDQAAIEREMKSLPGPDAWKPTILELNGTPSGFLRCERGGDWIAFRDLGGECLWVHAEQPDGTPFAIVAISDITPYLRDND